MSSSMHREDSRRPEWWKLPEELLELVLQNLPAFSDHIRFRSVCKEWRSLADPRHLPTQLPLLMLPYHPLADVRSFFCPATGESFAVQLPELVGKAVLSSSFGWMVLLDINTKVLSLLNPVTRSEIELPPTAAFHQLLDLRLASDGTGLRIAGYDGIPLSAMEFGTLCRWEVSLSSSPSSGEDCFVVVSDTCKVYFCSPGEKAWSSLSHHQISPRSAVYHGGRFYVMGAKAELAVFDAATLSKVKTIPSPVGSEAFHRYFFSLAKMNSSELVMFAGNPNIVLHERDPFQILKIDMGKEDEELEWSSIGDIKETAALYWSMKQCMVLGGRGEIPASVKGRIYFDRAALKQAVEEEGWHKISICRMKDGDCEVLSCGGEKPSEKVMKPAWVTLSLA